MRRCVIVGGAEIGNYPIIKSALRMDDFNIFCDCGLRHLQPLEIKADLIIGDFDSYQKPDCKVETIVLPTVKDDTDTVYAMREAIKRGFTEILLIGVLGGRSDHSLGNLYALLWLDRLNIKATIIDDYSELEIISSYAEISENYPYFSVLNIDASAHGISISGAKYCLDNAEILPEYQYGVSNEPLAGGARVSVREGRLLLIKDRV